MRTCPTVGVDGTVYFGSDDGKVYAVESSSVGGLAKSPWPKYRGNALNTGSLAVLGGIKALHTTNQFSLSLTTVAGHAYSLEFKPNLDTPTWTVITNLPGEGTVQVLIDRNMSGQQGFYRIRVE